MVEAKRALMAGILDFNPKRMTPDEAATHGIPATLHQHFGDWRQYPLNIASHFPGGIAWFSAEQPWFFRSVLSNRTQARRLRESDVLFLSGSGMSAQQFQENAKGHFKPEDIRALRRAQRLVRNYLAEGKWASGYCFGGQLGIGALGGSIGRLPEGVTEAGWLDHELTSAGARDELTADLPHRFFAPHFHNDYVERLPPVGKVIHTDHGDIAVTRSDVLAVRHGYLGKHGVENPERDYIMASVVEFDNGARFYQMQPHPEMATATKANFLVRMNAWLGGDKEMGPAYYQQAALVPQNADFRVAHVIPRFIDLAKKQYERQQSVHFVEAAILQNLFRYLLP